MTHSVMVFTVITVLAVILAGCKGTVNPAPSAIDLEYDFGKGKQGWEHGFAEYSPVMEIDKDGAIKPLPEELGIDGTGYYVQSMNRSDDVFMFLKRHIGADEGIVPGQTYRLIYNITFASNAPSGAVGIGGAPGESVFFKAGGSAQEPKVVLEDDYYVMNVDKGGGNSGEGPAATIAGDVANGIPAEEAFEKPELPYASVNIEHEHTYTVTATEDGDLWLLVGTDSGFEGLTGLYYQNISVTLEPVDE